MVMVMVMAFSLLHWLPVFLVANASMIGVGGASTRFGTINGHSCFRSMDGMMDSMNYLAEKNPKLMTINKIGESYLKNNEGRNDGMYEIPKDGFDIFAMVVSDSGSALPSKDKGKALFTSGVHAREYAPPELLARFIEKLVEGHGKDAEITTILQRTEIHVILYVNPDGRWMAEKYPNLYWRKNLNPRGGSSCRDDKYGVDINRNFDFFWSDPMGASSNPCASDYHGGSAESEPETQALAHYARKLFPIGQRKSDPEKDMNVPFGEGISGIYADVHSFGSYVFYPWGVRDAQSPDDEALQALGRKINSFNGYKLWAGTQPDFLYAATGDTSDYFYAAMGVASFGFEIGDHFYQECSRFENSVLPINMPALIYAAKIARRPFKEVKGPDVTDLSSRKIGGKIQVSATVSDSAMVNAIGGRFPNFTTGDQNIANVQLYLDVHPDDFKHGDTSWAMRPARRRLDSKFDTMKRTRINCTAFTKKKKCKRAGGDGKCEWFTKARQCGHSANASSAGANMGIMPIDSSKPTGSKPTGSEPVDVSLAAEVSLGFPLEESSVAEFNSGEENVLLTIDARGLSPGRHTLFVQATDSDGYNGPVCCLFIEVAKRQRESSLRGQRVP